MAFGSINHEFEESIAAPIRFGQRIRVLAALWAQTDAELSAIERIADELEAEADADTTGDEIENLYRKLNSLLTQPQTAATEQEYTSTLCRLRELQAIEAAEMEAVFERRNAFDERAAANALAQASQLLDKR